jgi:Fe-S oxidoreductase
MWARITRTGSPTTRRATRCGCCGWGTGRCGCCAGVTGIDLVALPDAEVCCGFGGTFALKNPDVSTAMLADKMRRVLATGAEVCTAGDSLCLMHIGRGLSRLRGVHLAEILAST